MRSFTLVTRPDAYSRDLGEKIRTVLTGSGWKETAGQPDTVFVVGGDGTFLYAVHQYEEALDRVTFYGIHTGTLGFYTDYRDADLDDFLKAFLEGRTREIRYPLLETVSREGTRYAINEMRIENARRTQEMEIVIDGRVFETFRGTGVCVSTQLGSTAYNRSLKGAVVQEGLNVIQLCEIAGIHHSRYLSLGSPLVLKADTELEFRSASFAGALLGHDSLVETMDAITSVRVRISRDRYVRMLRGRDVSYFDRLKSLF